MRVLIWHVHGSWTTSFVHGPHEYLVPVLPDRGPDGAGRARTWGWPSSAVEVTPAELGSSELDAVVLQRPHEVDLVEQWTGRRPGRDLPAVFLEHNTPRDFTTRHPMAEQSEVPVVHVTHFNRLTWDNGRAPTCVIEHGVVDPGLRYTGSLARAGVCVNEPVRRGRAVGTDLLPQLAGHAPLDVFGMKVAGLSGSLGIEVGEHDDLPQSRMHEELARRRVYLHPHRWTSLGLSLIEAMHLGMPVAALDTTEAARAVPRSAGLVSNDLDEIGAFVRRLLHDPAEAASLGRSAREAALARYSLERFLADWEDVLAALAAGTRD